jgi:tripeptidyl-peptidase-1
MWFNYKPILAFHRLILVQCLLLNTAQPLIQSPYAVKDNHTVPSGWEITARAPGEQQIHLQIGLKHGQFDELERHLYEGKTST